MHHYANITDLFTSFKAGDTKAFDAIYDQYADQLFRYVYGRIREKETSEEIVQEIFISLWTNRTAQEINAAYLFVAARNKTLTYMRSSSVRKKFAIDFTLFAAGKFDNSSEEIMNLNDLQLVIKKCLLELPDYYQTAFRMSRMEHVSTKLIAERMNISPRTVENYISKALASLRASLAKAMKDGNSVSHQI